MIEPTSLNNTKDTFLQDLRRETAESHQRLEDNPLSKSILLPAISIASYQVYLSRMYGMMKAVETDIFPILSDIFEDIEERRKGDFIAQDLLSTGLSAQAASELPVYHFGQASIPEALGIMYVLEGSTLGGRVLYKHVNEHLGLNEDHGARFFWGYGKRTGPLWKSFIDTFTQYAVEEHATEAVIGSAKKTFTTVDHWLSAKTER